MSGHDGHVIARIMFFQDHPWRCPNYWAHTKGPDGYIDWQEWAAEKQKTHKQRRCEGCGLYAIWTPRRNEPLEIEDFSEYENAI